VAPDGRMVVADRAKSRFLVFSPEGRFLCSMGGKGEGPGLFKRWFGAYALDEAWFINQVDYWGGNRGVSVFDLEGRLKRFIRLNLQEPCGPQKIFIGKDGQMRLLLERVSPECRVADLRFSGARVSLCDLDPRGGVCDCGLSVPVFHDFSDLDGTAWPAIPFRVTLLSAWSVESGVLGWQKADEEELHFFSPSSGRSWKTANGFQRRRVGRQELRDWVSEHMVYPQYRPFEAIYRKLLRSGRTVEPFRPVVGRVLGDQGGGFYVVSTRNGEEPYRVCHVLPQGRVARSFLVRVLPSWIGTDKVYSLDYDEKEDVWVLVVVSRDTTPW